MIEQFWNTVRQELVASGGNDRLVEFLEGELAKARLARAVEQTAQRQSPDYDGLIPDHIRHLAKVINQ